MTQEHKFGFGFGFDFESKSDSKNEVPPARETGRNFENGNDHKERNVKQ